MWWRQAKNKLFQTQIGLVITTNVRHGLGPMATPPKDLTATNLASLITPESEDVFFNRYFGKNFLYIKGDCNRFASLMPWSEVNSLLRHHHLDASRLRLAKSGKFVPSDQYLRPTSDGGPRSMSSILVEEFTTLLRDGATLVINGVDELFEPITLLAEGLERSFRVNINVNLYASWRITSGFDVHWDDHDVIVIQVAGLKRWQLFGPVDDCSNDSSQTKAPPRDKPLWEADVTSGDVLYVPRGWWHVATPCEQPAIHLTCGIRNFTGLDVMRFLERKLSSFELFRTPISSVAPPSVRANYAGQLRSALNAAVKGEFLEEFLEYADASARQRPLFGFPWIASHGILPESVDFEIRLRTPRGLMPRYGSSGSDVSIGFESKLIRYDSATAALLSYISSNAPLRFLSLCQQFEDYFTVAQLREFVSDLSIRGIVVATEVT
jgi:ribosomal protein L16 Arg81 hydroxylase